MEITQETESKIVIQMTKTYLGVMFAGMVLIVSIIMVVAISATNAQPRSGGTSRAPAGAPLVLFFVASPILIYLDWRRNRKALIMDSKERVLTIIGSQEQKFSLDEIQSFSLGADNNLGKISSRIDLQLKNGQRISSGINSDRGNAETTEAIMQKLSTRLKATSIQSSDF